MTKKAPHIFIVGPTASGKSDFSLMAADSLGCEILNTDSLLFYKDLNIGTAKPSKEDLRLVKHHLVNICSVGEDVNASDYTSMAAGILKAPAQKKLLCVGGSGFYINALNKGLLPLPETDQKVVEKVDEVSDPVSILKKIDPQTLNTISENDLYRVKRALQVFYQTGKTLSEWKREYTLKPFAKTIGFKSKNRDELYERVTKRTKAMVENGLLDEVKEILKDPKSKNWKPLKSVGYLQAVEYICGEIKTKDELIEKIINKTMQLAKRQKTWFKKDKDTTWFHYNECQKALDHIKNLFEENLWKA